MQDNFVQKTEFIETIANIQMKTNEMDIKLTNITTAINDLSLTVKELKKVIIESNGGASMIDKVKMHDQIISKMNAYIEEQKNNQLSRMKQIADTFWKYIIRLVVIATLSSFLALSIGHNEQLINMLKLILK